MGVFPERDSDGWCFCEGRAIAKEPMGPIADSCCLPGCRFPGENPGAVIGTCGRTSVCFGSIGCEFLLVSRKVHAIDKGSNRDFLSIGLV